MHPHTMKSTEIAPKVIAWELTRRCYLSCKHCRGSARDTEYDGELSTDECKAVIDSIASFSKPILIMTGGEPMIRSDIYELASYASSKGIMPVLAPCGSLLTPESVAAIKESGIMAISVSIDGATAESHDQFRGVKGAFENTLNGLAHVRDAGLRFQINTTVTQKNIHELETILELAIEQGASTLDLFFLVPTGRGKAISELAISPEQQESALQWVWEVSQSAPIRVKTTCAPHYARVQLQKRKSEKAKSTLPVKPQGHPGNAHGHPGGDPNYVSGGCMAGDGFVFISHKGVLQTCGFLDINCGDLTKDKFNFKKIYQESVLFQSLRDANNLEGKCGACEYRVPCGGCRARAYAETENYLAPEPGCSYVPRSLSCGECS